MLIENMMMQRSDIAFTYGFNQPWVVLSNFVYFVAFAVYWILFICVVSTLEFETAKQDQKTIAPNAKYNHQKQTVSLSKQPTRLILPENKTMAISRRRLFNFWSSGHFCGFLLNLHNAILVYLLFFLSIKCVCLKQTAREKM